MDYVKKILEKNLIEKENLLIPEIFFENDSLKELNRVLSTKNINSLASFFKNSSEKNLNIPFFKDIEKELKIKRVLKSEDLELIKNISEVGVCDSNTFFKMLGILNHISFLFDTIEEKKYPEVVKSTLMLWSYQMVYEMISTIFSGYVYDYASSDKIKNKSFLKNFKDNKHPPLGTLLLFLKKNKIISNRNYFFENIKRNGIAHGNIYFDPYKNIFISSIGKELNYLDFMKDLKYSYEILMEFILLVNGNSYNLREDMLLGFKALANNLVGLSRVSIARDAYVDFISDLEKN